MDEATLIKALGRRHDANLLEVGPFVDQHGKDLSLADIISDVRDHSGVRKVAHGKTKQIHIICEDKHQIVVQPKETEASESA